MARMKRRARQWHLKGSFSLVVLFAVGLFVSGAFGDVSPLTFSTSGSTDTTAATSSGDTSTDGTSSGATDATTTDATSTDSTTTDSTSGTSTAGTTQTDPSTTSTTPIVGAPVSYIVTFKDGVSDTKQLADISAANGTPGDGIAVLNMYSATFPAGEDAA